MSEQKRLQNQENPEDKLSTGLAILSFCIPIAGAVIYFSNKDTMPNKAKSACSIALISFILGILMNILATIAGV